MLRLYLARHGQTDWNLAQRLQGNVDTPLNETGQSQAQELARRLEGIRFARIYCSALRRSRQTAQALGETAPLVEMQELNERRLGAFEGAHLDGIDPKGEEYRRRRVVLDDDLDGGESLKQHYERVRRGVKRIRDSHTEGSVLVVGHGFTNAQFARVMIGLSATDPLRLRQDNAGVWLFDVHQSPDVAARMWVLAPSVIPAKAGIQ